MKVNVGHGKGEAHSVTWETESERLFVYVFAPYRLSDIKPSLMGFSKRTDWGPGTPVEGTLEQIGLLSGAFSESLPL